MELTRRIVAAAGDGEPGTRDRVLAFIDAHPDGLLRTCADGHLTASAAVVDAGAARILVLLHTKMGRWVQPGGHADGDADLAAVARREAEEETGIAGLRVITPAIDLDVHEFVAPGQPSHLHYDVRFLALAPPGAVPVGNAESRALRWVTVDELAALGTDVRLRRLARRAVDAARSLRRD